MKWLEKLISKTLRLLNSERLTGLLEEYNHQPFVKLVSELRPSRILEIGVSQGWSAERMVKAAGVQNGRDIEYYGFDLFRLCSKRVIRAKLEKLGVKKICLFKGDSRVTLPRVVSSLPKMDFVYIDGGHAYEVVRSDWENIKLLMHQNTVVVFDDYPKEGVRKAVNEIKGYQVEFICPYKTVDKYRKAVVTCRSLPIKR